MNARPDIGAGFFSLHPLKKNSDRRSRGGVELRTSVVFRVESRRASSGVRGYRGVPGRRRPSPAACRFRPLFASVAPALTLPPHDDKLGWAGSCLTNIGGLSPWRVQREDASRLTVASLRRAHGLGAAPRVGQVVTQIWVAFQLAVATAPPPALAPLAAIVSGASSCQSGTRRLRSPVPVMCRGRRRIGTHSAAE